MLRVLTFVLVAILAAACTATPDATPSSPAATVAATGSPTAEPTPTEAATEEPDTTPSASPEATTAGSQHVAAGLALADFIDEGSPVTQIFVIETDGSRRQLTGFGSPSIAGVQYPVWSPDGSRLIFGPGRIGTADAWHISVINADGTGERALVGLAEEWTLPWGWSPDGVHVLYADIDAVNGPAMWLVNVDSGEVTPLGVGVIPRWLPDGERISFLRAVEGRDPANPLAIVNVAYVVPLEGGDVTEIATADDAIWSPDGSRVLLLQEGVIYVADPDGSNAQRLANGDTPAWSPDGTRVAFNHDVNQDGVPLMAVADLDGEVIWDEVIGFRPTWSPDGTSIAAEISYPEQEIVIVHAETGEEVFRTTGQNPSWRP